MGDAKVARYAVGLAALTALVMLGPVTAAMLPCLLRTSAGRLTALRRRPRQAAQVDSSSPSGPSGAAGPTPAAVALMGALAGACLQGTRHRRRGLRVSRSASKAESLVGEMKEFTADLLAMRQNPNPRGGKRVGNSVWFDVTLSLPLGIALDNSSMGDAVGVTEVLDGGSAAEHNEKFMFEMDSSIAQNWVQQGDRLLMVNGVSCNSKEAAVELLSGAKDPSRVRLKFSRERTGFIQVAFPERNFRLPVRPRVLLRKVAEEAGVTFTCTASSCDGSCWHVDDRSKEVYRLCNDVLVGELPSRSQPSGQGGFSPFQEVKMQDFVDNDDAAMGFENTEPLALRPCPELYERAVWQSKRRQSAA